MNRLTACALAVVGFSAIAGSAGLIWVRAPADTVAMSPVFSEEKWPFLLDQWGIGKAFVCQPAACDGKVEIFIRPKIGFCNCATGVSDDRELERVADLHLLTANAQPLSPGHTIKIGWMNGLARTYEVSGKAEHLISVAFNDECDVVVAVATLGSADPATVEPAVIRFLGSDPMVRWAKKELGLEFVRREW
jgi:hypothetical protein